MPDAVEAVLDRKFLAQLDRCRVPHDTGPFTFRRGHSYYWIVTGPVPIEVAWELYRDPCADQIRVDGHCGCPEPVEPWVKWRMWDGTELAAMKDKHEIEAIRDRQVEAGMANVEFWDDYMKKFTFSDDPKVRKAAKAYVEMYHIDSEVGLRVFVDHLLWHRLI